MAAEACRRPRGEGGAGEPAQQQVALRAAREGSGEPLGRGGGAHTGSLSTATQSSISPRSRSGCSTHVWAASSHASIERANSGLDATAPLSSSPNRWQQAFLDAQGEPLHPAAQLHVVVRPSHASAQSTSDPGNGSKRPKLRWPATCRAPALGRGSWWASSISRRVALSWTLAMAREIAAAGSSASCRAITVWGSSAVAAATAATSRLRAKPARRRNRARRSLAIRSTSSSTPISRLPGSSTGRWRTPWSSISSSASVPVRSPAMVPPARSSPPSAGFPAVRRRPTRVLMSRSVTMPKAGRPGRRRRR